jgi:transcription antitermination factor NusG
VKGILYEAVKTVVENHYQDVSVNEQIEIMAGILADLEGLIQEVTMSTKALN